MQQLREDFVAFGKLHIPPLDESLTAFYGATTFAELTRTWKFRAYLTRPGTRDLIDQPSVTLTVSSLLPARGRHADGTPRPEMVRIIQQTVSEHPDVWSELAQR